MQGVREIVIRIVVMGAVLVGVPGVAAAQDMVVKNAKIVVAAVDPSDVKLVGVISNPGMYSTYLVSATSDAAERVELRDARKGNAVVKEVEIAAYGSLTLEAKGLYLKLVNPKRPLKAGTRVDVVLTNDAQAKVKVSAVVGP